VIDHSTRRTDPLALAILEISQENLRFADKRQARLRLASLRWRSDRILERFEMLNLMKRKHVPEASRLELVELVADLPFDNDFTVKRPLKPTKAVNLVFDIQAALVWFITGTQPLEDDLEDVAS
jgi:hypothetical protein